MLNYHIVIPARYHSQRLPGKLLLPVNGKPMLQRVYEQAAKANPQHIIIATDNDQIAALASTWDVQVCMTSPAHPNGTDRIAEVIETLKLPDEAIIVNVQGDEVLIPPENITCVANLCHDDLTIAAATLYEPIDSIEDVFDPNIVKVVFNKAGLAQYFTRAPVSWEREHFGQNRQQMAHPHYRHVGLYAYRARSLRHYIQSPPSEDEKAEKLEQLRILWHGYKIRVVKAPVSSLPGIDTQADLVRIEHYLSKNL